MLLQGMSWAAHSYTTRKWRGKYKSPGGGPGLLCSNCAATQLPLYPKASLLSVRLDMGAQIAQSLDNLETVLDNAGFEMSDVVRLNLYTTDVDSTLEAWSSQINDRLAQSGCRQVSTLLGVASLYHPDILIEIEATAVA